MTILAPGTYARHGREGISEESVARIVEFLLLLPNDAWIESIEVRPTLFAPKGNNG
jgi:hypothetical protein